MSSAELLDTIGHQPPQLGVVANIHLAGEHLAAFGFHAWLCATVGNNKNSWAATSKRFSPIPPLRSSTVCRPSSSACTAALHSFSAGVTAIPRAGQPRRVGATSSSGATTGTENKAM